jgi:hypothetical protein
MVDQGLEWIDLVLPEASTSIGTWRGSEIEQ